MAKISYEEKLEIKKKTHRQLMYIGIFSIIMMFAGLSSAYIVSKADGTWVKIFPPMAFYISSVVIVISSITYVFALKYLKTGNNKVGSVFVLITFVLGLVFSAYQVKGWETLHEKGNYLGGYNNIRYLLENDKAVYGEDYVIVQKGKELNYFEGKFYDNRDVNFTSPVKKVNLDVSNNSSSYFYLLTGLHLLHLLGGLISLMVVLIKSFKKKYSDNDHIGVKVSLIYWHFLDFLWLYLLCLLYFVG